MGPGGDLDCLPGRLAMRTLKITGHRGLLTGAAYAAALCVGMAAASASAQEFAPAPEVSQYICLSNGCVPPSAVRAPAAPAARPAPVSPAARATTQAGIQAEIASRLLEGLTPEQRATARVTNRVEGDRVTVDLEYQGPNGRGTKSMMRRMPSN